MPSAYLIANIDVTDPVKFPSVEAARRVCDSTEYEAAKKARGGAAVMRMIVVEGQ